MTTDSGIIISKCMRVVVARVFLAFSAFWTIKVGGVCGLNFEIFLSNSSSTGSSWREGFTSLLRVLDTDVCPGDLG